MSAALAVGEAMKEQVVDSVPKRIKELKFGILSKQDIINYSVLEVCDRNLFKIEEHDKELRLNGPLDARLGPYTKIQRCETCGEGEKSCSGHFGHIRLALPVFHVGYFKMVTTILQEICKDCSRILLSEPERRSFLKDLRRPNIDNLKKTQICKKILEQCKKTKQCISCLAINGTVKKAGHPLKIIHDRFRAFNQSASVKKIAPVAKMVFDQSFNEAKKSSFEVDKHVKKAMDDLNPLRVFNLFRRITASDCELLGMHPAEGRPEMFLWQFLPAPPVCIRPSVQGDGASTEDDLTVKLTDIVNISNLIREGLKNGQPVSTIMEQWDFLQVQVAMYVNSDVPGLQQPGAPKATRGFCQRLKGKQGRFRGNLSGKRVDFSGRTVISPDPNLGIDQVAVPELVAKTLTYPETVSQYNIEKLRERVKNGKHKWPGANYLIKKDDGFQLSLKYANNDMFAARLQVGDVVERHLEDGDIVLFNRQPSLHKLSILSHYVKVRPHRTFRLNECVCNPYNADFDGDEMNLHVPQTEEARTEAMELMGVKHNLVTPKNGEPIISAIQDFITAAYLLSSKDNFYDRKNFTNICMYMLDGNAHLDLPPPTILKPVMLWTGKQVFNVMMRPNKSTNVLVNLDAACREYRAVPKQSKDLDINDGWLCIRNSEIMCGVMDKSTIGSGKKDSVFYVTLRDFGPDAAVQSMNRLAKLSARWLTNQGFSIGISDVYPGGKLVELKTQLVERAYTQCDALIEEFKDGKLAKAPGCDEEQTMENLISGILSKVRQQAGDYCISELSRWNSPLIMATSGSKGSSINVSQMVAVVGQQIIGGKRVADGFQDRSLPHFPKHARQPPSKGFVRNSFFSGLSPTEFLFHAISGREGLVDTAVKTAETGYMSRRLMKSLEDLSSQYDDTVRNSSSNIIQFKYGDDMLDPVDMEGKAKPVNFDRTFIHAETTTWSNDERGLLPWEITSTCKELLATERAKLARISSGGKILSYSDHSVTGIDQMESARDFLDSIEDFVNAKAHAQGLAREKLGMPSEMSKTEMAKWKHKDASFQVHVARDSLDRTAKLSKTSLVAFVKACMVKYKRAQVEPGHAVGAVGAQSIGEPGTQMTLKTFHFAGVAGMSITQGVPRIKEIINASKVISTPIISCELTSKKDIIAARVVKGRIEKTFLRDVRILNQLSRARLTLAQIIYYVELMWALDGGHLLLKIDHETIGKLQLDITNHDIIRAIVKHKKLKIGPKDIEGFKDYVRIRFHLANTGKVSKAKARDAVEMCQRMESIQRALPNITIRGYPEASRAVISTDDQSQNTLLVEGYGLRACMTTEGVNGLATRTNSVMEMREVLGIEAARKTIIDEIQAVMGDMDIDPRHMQLLADVMTYKGEVLGITRFGLSKMRDSVLQLASFEKTPDHLFEAAWHMKSDRIEGVSECIIMGQTMSVGTGAFKLVRKLDREVGDFGKRETVFEDSFNELMVPKRVGRK
ncbi:hypothetical protein MMC13_003712 [Lambiella insularis]|nr:hypothetical protein [Lambiella insularis]